MGAAAAAVAFIGAETLVVLYLRTSVLRSVYGAAGSFIVVLFWFYISSYIFLFGAEMTRAYTAACGFCAQLARSLVSDAPEAYAAVAAK